MTSASSASIGNLLSPLPDVSAAEVFGDILNRAGCRIERIVSRGQTTPEDRPYQQGHDEWVLVLSGYAIIDMEGQASVLRPGDHLLIPAGTRHRVTHTALDQPTVWLAVHIGEAIA